jgi:uncharacterized repeat protein (TIGR03847 family)
MAEMIDLGPVDVLAAGAIGQPGQRTFLIQARKDGSFLTVLVEKQQVAMLAEESVAFLDEVAEEYPEPRVEAAEFATIETHLCEPTVPLFRAQLIGLGFDTQRELVLIELREQGEDDDVAADEEEIAPSGVAGGFVARLYATRAQVRAMAACGADAVAAGRERCQLCDQPMDPAGHICPRWN